MADRAVRRDPGRDGGGRLSAWMEPSTTAPGAPLSRSSRRRVPGRTGDAAAGTLIADRGAHPAVAVGPYGAAPGAHDGRGAHGVDGRARGPAARWRASADPRCRARIHERSGGSTLDAVARASRRRLVCVRPELLDLAYPGALRAGDRVRPLAPRRARVFPRERAAVLATRDPRMAGAGDLAALDDDSVPGPRHVPEPAAGRDPDVLGPRDLRRIFVRRRPGAGRRHHVGAGVASSPVSD